jgi:xeroderma pigmentosum group C-complementing protein
MSDNCNDKYKELLKDQIRVHTDRIPSQRKKRKISNKVDLQSNDAKTVIVIDSDDNASNQSINTRDDSVSREVSDSDDSDDFEEVDLNVEEADLNDEEQELDGFGLLGEETKKNENETLTFALEQTKDDLKKGKRKFVPISKEEREMRRSMHQTLVVLMMMHGAIRNMWCNDYNLSLQMKKLVSPQVMSLLFPLENDEVLQTVKARRFLDGLQKLMRTYGQKFRTTSQGIIRKNWNELMLPQKRRDKNIDFDRFKLLVSNFRGSRDIGAQGFVSLLRSLGLIARLVFSLQPPDFTSTASYPPIEEERKQPLKTKTKPNQIIQKFGMSNSKANLLSAARSNVSSTDTEEVQVSLESSTYPIFWVEVWNKYAKKWVSIDPIVLETLEYAPTRKKSKFEPPLTEQRNQLHYVIAYDRMGGVKDVTRRYSQYYNARAVKKKIQFRSIDDEIWYQRVLRAVSSPIRLKPSKLDILESIEFHNRDRAEGMPNNIADFKNHPTYALETQLKQNEAIYPNDQTSKCGTFRYKSTRTKNNNGVVPVFKRSHVHLLRSAKAWYMRGRILKVGAHALKLKKNNNRGIRERSPSRDDSDEEEEFTRLYAKFQTELFKPQPIVDGIIPKNVYGNIDVYTPTMLPENGYLVNTTGMYSMKMAERAARQILDIDYARAIVAFDFGKSAGEKRSKASTRIPTAKEGGIVIHEDYKDAIMLILESLLEEEVEYQRNAIKFNSFKNWRYFLTKLRISERLNREHGKIEKPNKKTNKKTFENESEEDETDELDNDNYSVYDGSGSDIDEEEINEEEEVREEDGGFIASTTSDLLQNDKDQNFDLVSLDQESLDEGGGFFFEASPSPKSEMGKLPKELIVFNQDFQDDEDIPDTLFRMGDDGELIYNPEKGERDDDEELFYNPEKEDIDYSEMTNGIEDTINDSNHKAQTEAMEVTKINCDVPFDDNVMQNGERVPNVERNIQDVANAKLEIISKLPLETNMVSQRHSSVPPADKITSKSQTPVMVLSESESEKDVVMEIESEIETFPGIEIESDIEPVPENEIEAENEIESESEPVPDVKLNTQEESQLLEEEDEFGFQYSDSE